VAAHAVFLRAVRLRMVLEALRARLHTGIRAGILMRRVATAAREPTRSVAFAFYKAQRLEADQQRVTRAQAGRRREAMARSA